MTNETLAEIARLSTEPVGISFPPTEGQVADWIAEVGRRVTRIAALARQLDAELADQLERHGDG